MRIKTTRTLLAEPGFRPKRVVKIDLKNPTPKLGVILDLMRYYKFDCNKKGWVVYKYFGKNKPYPNQEKWVIKRGSTITAYGCDRDRYEMCSFGVNFGTLKWIKENNFYRIGLWKCVIPFSEYKNVVMPYNSSGKGRCKRLILLKQIK